MSKTDNTREPELTDSEKSALLELHTKFVSELNPFLRLAFAHIREYMDEIYSITDVHQKLESMLDEVDFSFDQILTHVLLAEKVFDNLVRPIAPERFAKKKKAPTPEPVTVWLELLRAVDQLVLSYAKMQLNDTDCDDNSVKILLSKVALLCVLLSRFIFGCKTKTE